MATKKISELTAVTNAAGADTFVFVQGGVTYKGTRAQNASKGADIASATTTDIGAATGEYVEVTGSITITGFGTAAAGTKRIVRFMGALTLTHNATSLILKTGANIVTVADDVGEFISLGSGNWFCKEYSRKDGTPLTVAAASTTVSGIIEIATNAEALTGTDTARALTADDLKYVLTNLNYTINEGEGAAIASAATTNIWSVDGNTVHITNTNTITSFGTAGQAGAWKKVIFDDALTLTHGANLNLQGSLNISTAANDWAFVYADTTTLFRVVYFRASGAAIQPLISFSVNKGGVDQTAIVTATPTKVTWPTEEWDVGSTFASDKWIPGKLGRYHSIVHLYSTTFGSPQMLISIYKNGVSYKEDVIYSNASIQTLPFNVDLDVDTITDYFEVYVTHNLGSNATLSGLATRTWWQGHEVR